jgi:hypothetical protein
MEVFLTSGAFSDCTVTTLGRTFHLHRVVLSAHSVFFRHCFQAREFAEGASSAVELTCFPVEVLEAALAWMYGAPVTKVNPVNLLSCSDYLGCAVLQRLLSDRIHAELSPWNFREFLFAALGDAHNRADVVQLVIDKLARQFHEVYTKDFSDLPWDVMRAILAHGSRVVREPAHATAHAISNFLTDHAAVTGAMVLEALGMIGARDSILTLDAARLLAASGALDEAQRRQAGEILERVESDVVLAFDLAEVRAVLLHMEAKELVPILEHPSLSLGRGGEDDVFLFVQEWASARKHHDDSLVACVRFDRLSRPILLDLVKGASTMISRDKIAPFLLARIFRDEDKSDTAGASLVKPCRRESRDRPTPCIASLTAKLDEMVEALLDVQQERDHFVVAYHQVKPIARGGHRNHQFRQ